MKKKNNQVHWLAQNFKDLQGGGYVVSIITIIAALLMKYLIVNQIYSYGRGLFSHWVMMILVLCLIIFCIVMTIVNYRYLLREGKCEPQPKKFAGLLILEMVCFIVVLSILALPSRL